MNIIKTLYKKLKSEAVLCIAGTAAVITMLLVPPSMDYLEYIDFRVLALLFCLMAVIAGFNRTGVFLLLSEKLLKKATTTRSLFLVLILLCFFSSMWITNDVALITFVPFSILLLDLTRQKRHMIFVVVLQTIAANLGSMLTPVGNPQNLYLYSYYQVALIDFILITLPVTALSLLLLWGMVFFMKKEPLSFTLPAKDHDSKTRKRNIRLTVFYSLLFLLCLACVLRFVDYRITLAIVLLSILVLDIRVLKKVDYLLLLTFVFFFLFVGNIGNIPVIRDFLSALLKSREMLVSILASQIISNVPAAVLLSAFTDQGEALILGTNLGGLGTLVASLASLISYKFYSRTEEAKPGNYLAVFTLYNIGFLILLYLFLWLFRW